MHRRAILSKIPVSFAALAKTKMPASCQTIVSEKGAKVSGNGAASKTVQLSTMMSAGTHVGATAPTHQTTAKAKDPRQRMAS